MQHDIINKLFDTIIDEIKDWLERDLEKWDQLVNNCLSVLQQWYIMRKVGTGTKK